MGVFGLPGSAMLQLPETSLAPGKAADVVATSRARDRPGGIATPHSGSAAMPLPLPASPLRPSQWANLNLGASAEDTGNRLLVSRSDAKGWASVEMGVAPPGEGGGRSGCCAVEALRAGDGAGCVLRSIEPGLQQVEALLAPYGLALPFLTQLVSGTLS
mmetsp:Transcript_68896/g.190741  ORF Transcript_68896/g.190741 Transcript_68896/m.190741 type:complete len:159 (-) Transcript_68896:361-837(-)